MCSANGFRLVHTKLFGFSLTLASVVLLLAASTYGAGRPQKESSSADSGCSITEEDYAAYSAILANRGGYEDPEERWDDKPDLVIAESTATGDEVKSRGGGWGFRSNSREAPSSETNAAFDLRSTQSCQIQHKINYSGGYSLISEKEINHFFKKHGSGWKGFYEKYPKSSGFWRFSLVGYNQSKEEAVVYVSHSCGSLCGTGHLYLLRRINGHWSVENRLMLWIS